MTNRERAEAFHARWKYSEFNTPTGFLDEFEAVLDEAEKRGAFCAAYHFPGQTLNSLQRCECHQCTWLRADPIMRQMLSLKRDNHD